jgi:hypothetical protein
MPLADRYKPRAARNRYVINEDLAHRVWRRMQQPGPPLLGGEIADMMWGPNSNRPESKSVFHEAVSQLNKILKREYGVELMSTTAYRLEEYAGEKARRRGR